MIIHVRYVAMFNVAIIYQNRVNITYRIHDLIILNY